ncbi:glycosyltransferase family 1 protein [Streptomyces ipomoeae]|uniref:Glycosyltransferase, group 1 family protein n=2 Tax=Streptomyces ipomoeae TaxID=103232 RepID=L1L5I9_9ACTN|nr:glycosyltransferase [Streptomyces ipomoeae]EKX67965.1 glycosyltransferase, group 1 family protein [Streptomyces ipomoeae 91-03]MDX2696196.1 glycosyltransferase [Streptomyces ipomoeae]MDX2845069.1 glycosyltransferase [Streptomyces ipomoeae]TQE17292.1 glycosyltransferase family 1 protein [Streptomyces ipomoeae]TQE21536.1 glycosyltransferase family 1 protein [Streptomyces ipomoeae]
MSAPTDGLRIVRLANFVAPASGGLRTALRELGKGFKEAGHEPVLVVPGERHTDRETEQGRVITLPGPLLPGTGGYRVLTDKRRVAGLLESLGPDRLEVSDRTTLRWTGAWARRARVPAVMVSHETADGVLRTWGLSENMARRTADALNVRTAHTYSRVVCTTEFAEREFVRIGARNVVRAPLGVDLVGRHPALRDPGLRERYARVGRVDDVLLVMCSRLSVEKRPGTAIEALEALLRRGRRAVLVVAGDGPLRGRLEQRAKGLPVTFLGHVADRDTLGALQASADVCLAPGPAETFGLAALEAMACGTPVVASSSSALPEVVGSAGATAADNGESFADAVEQLLDRPERDRREGARVRAECFSWRTAVDAFLAAHDAPVGRPEQPVRTIREGVG